MFERIKLFYEKKLWTAQMVGQAVSKCIITAAQYAEIVGEEHQSAE